MTSENLFDIAKDKGRAKVLNDNFSFDTDDIGFKNIHLQNIIEFYIKDKKYLRSDFIFYKFKLFFYENKRYITRLILQKDTFTWDFTLNSFRIHNLYDAALIIKGKKKHEKQYFINNKRVDEKKMKEIVLMLREKKLKRVLKNDFSDLITDSQ